MPLHSVPNLNRRETWADRRRLARAHVRAERWAHRRRALRLAVWAILRWFVATGWKHRVTLRPVWVGLALAVAAATFHVAQGGWTWAVLCVITGALYLGYRGYAPAGAIAVMHRALELRPAPMRRLGTRAAGLPLLRNVSLPGTRRTRFQRRRIIYAWTVYGLASLWFLVAVRAGAGRPMSTGYLPLLVAACGIPWWWHRRIRSKTDPAWMQTWAELVACDGGVLPGSYLTSYRTIRGGWTAVIQLIPGKGTTEQAITALARVASAFQVPLSSVTIEPTPGGDASRAVIRVLEDNPLEEAQLWQGPSAWNFVKGLAPICVYSDLDIGFYQFWRQHSGAVHTLISGCTDSGKSRLLELLLSYERHSCGLIVSWLCDPQRGQSVPAYKRHVDYFAGSVEEGLRMLQLAQAIMYARNAYLADLLWEDEDGDTEEGKSFFEPSVEMPLLSITIDEAHKVLKLPAAVAIAEELATMGRKCGVKLRLVTPVPLVDNLGGSMTLRDAVASGNVIVFRTQSRLTKDLAFNGLLAVDPTQLPRKFGNGLTTGGLGFMLGDSDRPSTMRTFYVPKPKVWATSGETVALDELSRRAREQALEELEELEELAALAGAPAPLLRGAGASTGGAGALPALPQPRRSPGEVPALILAFLGTPDHAQASTSVIADCIGAPKSSVSDALGRLVAKGQVRQMSRGVYALAPHLVTTGAE
jgi:hypothetical protein